MSIWSTQEIQILLENYEKLGCVAIQSLLPTRSIHSIHIKASRLGLGNLWTDKEILILRTNYGKIKVKDFEKLLPKRSIKSIISKARKLGLSSNLECNIYSVNQQFFDEPSIENSYWAGWIAADGNLYKGQTGQFIFQARIHSNDVELLEVFCSNTEYNGPIYKVKDKKGRNAVHLSVHSVDRWALNLYKYYNITERKSLTLNPPKISDFKQKLAYIIGYIDGDGCITKFKPKESKEYPILMITGTESVLKWISNTLYELEDRTKFEPLKLSKNKNVYFIQCKRLRALNLISELKKIQTPYKLPRKWNVINETNVSDI